MYSPYCGGESQILLVPHEGPAKFATARQISKDERESHRALLIQRVAARYLMWVPGGGLIVVSLPSEEDPAVSQDVTDLLMSKLKRGRVESLSRNNEATVISYVFRAPPKDALLEVQAELQRRSAQSTVDIFLNRTGTP